MFPNEIRGRQEKLADCIIDLSKNVLDKEKNEYLMMIKRLQKLYEDGFKHSYSDFFPVLLKIKEEKDCDIDYLGTNLEMIRDILEIDCSEGTNQYQDIYDQFIKLCDHLNLQISELAFFLSTEDKVNDASAKMQQTNENLNTAQKNLEEANIRAKSLQTELIAVLSIFAAIVTTFSGGFTFLGSVMTSINGAQCYEIVVLTAIICGLIIFNTIFLMMYLVAKITDRNIYAKCRTSNCSCDSNEYKCSGLRRIRKRLPYVFYFNVMGILGIIVDCIVWGVNIRVGI